MLSQHSVLSCFPQVEEAKLREERQAAEAARREAERRERAARAAAYQEAAWVAGEGEEGSEEEEEEASVSRGSELPAGQSWPCHSQHPHHPIISFLSPAEARAWLAGLPASPSPAACKAWQPASARRCPGLA
jgi:hypothetical protein